LHTKLLSNELWLKPEIEIEIEEYVPKSQTLGGTKLLIHIVAAGMKMAESSAGTTKVCMLINQLALIFCAF